MNIRLDTIQTDEGLKVLGRNEAVRQLLRLSKREEYDTERRIESTERCQETA